jgi:hypothetical protein
MRSARLRREGMGAVSWAFRRRVDHRECSETGAAEWKRA